MLTKVQDFLYSPVLWKKFITHTIYVIGLVFSCLCALVLLYISRAGSLHFDGGEGSLVLFFTIFGGISVLVQSLAYAVFHFAKSKKYTAPLTLSGLVYPLAMILFVIVTSIMRALV